jgi:anti-sigma factor RsiW
MRCQRVRYYLSAYCRDELPGGKRKAIAAHLQICSECRREEAVQVEMAGAAKGLPSYEVAGDFNTRLLNRIAAERFHETRTRAFFPKRVPLVNWGRAVPIMVAACFVLAFVFAGGMKNIFIRTNESAMTAQVDVSHENGMDNSYMTVQPQANRTFAQHANSGWTFRKQVARANRIRGLMNSLASDGAFNTYVPQAAGNPFILRGPGFYIEIPLSGQPIIHSESAPQTRTADQTY